MSLDSVTENGAGQDLSFESMFQAEYASLVRSMYWVVHDREQARDIAQEAFTQLFLRWWRISKYDRPEAWVRRVAIRIAIRTIKRERVRRQLEHEFEVAPSQGLIDVDVDVLRAVAQLPGTQRAAVVLFYLEDRPVAEVADILSCSESTAKVHLYRARKRLAELLGDEESWGDTVDAS